MIYCKTGLFIIYVGIMGYYYCTFSYYHSLSVHSFMSHPTGELVYLWFLFSSFCLALQIMKMEEKLQCLQEEKHQLFLQLKKVLHEEEKRRRKEQR